MKLRNLLILSLAFSVNVMSAEPKEDPNTTQAPGVPFGGPISDAFGYTVTDSSGAVCVSQFVDISATGASVVVGDDVSSGPLALQSANSFDFYGTALTSIVMASNGYLSTDLADSGGDLSNDCPLPVIPSTGAGARIYTLHDDLDLEPGIGNGLFEYFSVCPRPSDQFPSANLGCHVFQWDEVEHFPGGSGTPFDVQAILYDDSYEIVLQHDDRNPENGSGSTTGMQNDGATIGLTHSCDTAASIPANSAQCFVHPTPNVVIALAPAVPVPSSNIYTLLMLALMLSLGTIFAIKKNKEA